MVLLLSCLIVAAASSSLADDHKGERKHRTDHGVDNLFAGEFFQGHDKGNETTGQIVGWSLAVANLAVALSIVIKAVKRFAPLQAETQKALVHFNGAQKRALMWLHYILNPVILLIGLLHWSLSRCRSTALPEWGILVMGALVVLGIVLKFKLCPKPMVQRIYRLHTQPLFFLLLISMLVIGHLSMD